MKWDAVDCRCQLRKFQKLYNADPCWNGQVQTHLIFGWMIYLEFYLLCFVRFWRYKLPHLTPIRWSTPTATRVRNQSHVTRNRNASLTQCMAWTIINTSKHMPSHYDKPIIAGCRFFISFNVPSGNHNHGRQGFDLWLHRYERPLLPS